MRPSRPVNRDKGCSPARVGCGGMVGMSVTGGRVCGLGILSLSSRRMGTAVEQEGVADTMDGGDIAGGFRFPAGNREVKRDDASAGPEMAGKKGLQIFGGGGEEIEKDNGGGAVVGVEEIGVLKAHFVDEAVLTNALA